MDMVLKVLEKNLLQVVLIILNTKLMILTLIILQMKNNTHKMGLNNSIYLLKILILI